jgi:polyferredoxin
VKKREPYCKKPYISVWSVLGLVKNISIRKIIQAGWAIISNSYFTGFISGKIYTGKLKNICVPGLNCYSCPGSLGSCPIGSLQAVLGSSGYRFSFYLAGFFLVIGTLFGRLVCGFLCPFGLIQELLNKIPFLKKIKTFRFDMHLRYLKYVILLIFVIILPMLIVDAVGGGEPWFCKWICPVGTFEGGIPLVLSNPTLQNAVGFLYTWKIAILFVTIIFSIIIYRPFCKYVCPLGAIYALFNKVSIYGYRIENNKCTDCKQCENICPMKINPRTQCNHAECIRCGACKKSCNSNAIISGFQFRSYKLAENDMRLNDCEKEMQKR